MFVLSEEEYNRLKLQHKVSLDDESPSVVNKIPHDPVSKTIVDEPQTDIDDDIITPLPSRSPPSIKTYKCSICTRVYKHRSDLKRHVKLVHGISPPTQVAIPSSLKPNTIKNKHKKKNKKKKSPSFIVFDKVKKWMTLKDV